jgi:hypothetical protein
LLPLPIFIAVFAGISAIVHAVAGWGLCSIIAIAFSCILSGLFFYLCIISNARRLWFVICCAFRGCVWIEGKPTTLDGASGCLVSKIRNNPTQFFVTKLHGMRRYVKALGYNNTETHCIHDVSLSDTPGDTLWSSLEAPTDGNFAVIMAWARACGLSTESLVALEKPEVVLPTTKSDASSHHDLMGH